MAAWLMVGATFVVAYLLGSIPTGYLFAKYLKGIDIRTMGSGSIGATNILRTLGKKAGFTVLVIDILKGVGAIFAKCPKDIRRSDRTRTHRANVNTFEIFGEQISGGNRTQKIRHHKRCTHH